MPRAYKEPRAIEEHNPAQSLNRKPIIDAKEVDVLLKNNVEQVAQQILGKYNISISSMQQEESLENEPTSVVILTHLAKVGDYTKSIQEIDSLKEIIKEPTISFPLMENM